MPCGTSWIRGFAAPTRPVSQLAPDGPIDPYATSSEAAPGLYRHGNPPTEEAPRDHTKIGV